MLSSETSDPQEVVDEAIETINDAGGIEELRLYPVDTWEDSATFDAVITFGNGETESLTWKLYKEGREWLVFHDRYSNR